MRSYTHTPLRSPEGGRRRVLLLALLPHPQHRQLVCPERAAPGLAPTYLPTYLTRGWVAGVPARSRPGRGPTPRESTAPGRLPKQRGARQDQSVSTGSRRPCSALLCHASHATPLHPAARGRGRAVGVPASLTLTGFLVCCWPRWVPDVCSPSFSSLPPKQATPSESARRPRALTPPAVWPELWGRRTVRGLQ